MTSIRIYLVKWMRTVWVFIDDFPKWRNATDILRSGFHGIDNNIKLDMSTARRRLKSSRSLSGTSAHPTMVTQVNIMVMNGYFTSFSFVVNQPPHSWDKAISDSHLQTLQGQGHWVWSKGKVIQSAQYHINSLPLHFTSVRPTIPEIELFRNLTLKHPRSRSWVRWKVKVTYCTQYPTNALPFRFTSIGLTITVI